MSGNSVVPIPRKVDNTPSRPVAPCNINYPPRDRQRIHRACETCRRKKIKCDGEEPCRRCFSYGTRCAYVDFASSARSSGPRVEKLEDRVASIEQMFRQFMEQFKSGELQVNPELRGVGALPPTPDMTEGDASTTTQRGASVAGSAAAGGLADDEDNLADEGQEGFEEEAQAPVRAEVSTYRYCYADGFGELDPDLSGQLRYVGLGSTASIVDRCIGLRQHINAGLKKRGFDLGEPFLTSPAAATGVEPPQPDTTHSPSWVVVPPQRLADVLIEAYSEQVYFMFPIISKSDVVSLYDELLRCGSFDAGLAAVFSAVLAVAAPLIPREHAVFNDLDDKYSHGGIGPYFYNQAIHFLNLAQGSGSDRSGKLQEHIVAVGLLSMYLSETGSQADAWIMIGRAIRLAQDIGLHRSPERLQLPPEERARRRFIWWCLYILDRQLSIALGRPLAVDDSDCDVEVPSETIEGSRSIEVTGFVSCIHLHTILGSILKTVNSIKNANEWRSVEKFEELRSRVRSSNSSLQRWAKYQVSQQIKTAATSTNLAEKHILLSSYYSAAILLHRAFMPHPHRQSPLESSQAQTRCAKAATDCIHGSAGFLESVPAGHYYVLHGQNIFVSAIILMQCVRGCNDQMYTEVALRDVEMALQNLRILEAFWKGARKCRGVVEEYLDLTLRVLQGDYKKGVCNFTHPPGGDHVTSGGNHEIRSQKRGATPFNPQTRSGPTSIERPSKRQMRAESSPTQRNNTTTYRNLPQQLDPPGTLAHPAKPGLSTMKTSSARLGNPSKLPPGSQAWPFETDDDTLFVDSFDELPVSISQRFPAANDMFSVLDIGFEPGDLTITELLEPWAIGDQGMFF